MPSNRFVVPFDNLTGAQRFSAALRRAAERPAVGWQPYVRETADSDPVSVVNEYFSRMRARDLSVVELFHEDASLFGLGAQRCGRTAILEFYRDVINRAGPLPRQAGPLLAEHSRIAAEIYIDLPNGSTIHAVDLFCIEAGLIRSLTYFIASD